MTVETVPMYRVLCNACGKSDENDDYYAWADDETALLFASEAGWLLNDDGQWCKDCTTWDEESDERVPVSPQPNQGEK